MDDYLKPREKLIRSDINTISDYELIAIILGSGTKRQDVMQVASNLLTVSNGLNNLQYYTVEQLKQFHGIGVSKAICLRAVFELVNRIKIEKHIARQTQITTPESVYDLCKEFAIASQESVIVLTLNIKFELVKKTQIHKGTVSSVTISPRDILHEVLINNGYGFILVHNHPSGDTYPSNEDIKVTKAIEEIAKAMEIKFIDHIIIGRSKFTSLRSEYPAAFVKTNN